MEPQPLGPQLHQLLCLDPRRHYPRPLLLTIKESQSHSQCKFCLPHWSLGISFTQSCPSTARALWLSTRLLLGLRTLEVGERTDWREGGRLGFFGRKAINSRVGRDQCVPLNYQKKPDEAEVGKLSLLVKKVANLPP